MSHRRAGHQRLSEPSFLLHLQTVIQAFSFIIPPIHLIHAHRCDTRERAERFAKRQALGPQRRASFLLRSV
ncbi:Predicted protein [Anoxybacillus flavithermus WK1]|uniref:Uncharacterized protein n=1 Tax=Anoxybacillus flavithermus (strain DSM 21510 / WK1) TaxID=491915 RepID=B7GL88_ANOFW|nr:Predicted protein [Anoxybacillus flavithermus WK1]